MNKNQFERLPKWAQKEFVNLMAKVEYLQEELRESRHDIPDTDTYISSGINDLTPLPIRSTIEFHLKNGWVRVKVDEYDNWLNISAKDMLYIRPTASNTAEVASRPWSEIDK